jgi:hypothetical protein
MKPVFTEDGVNYVYVQHNNVYLVALTRKNSNVVMILVFLEKLIEVSAALCTSATCLHANASTPCPARSRAPPRARPRRS